MTHFNMCAVDSDFLGSGQFFNKAVKSIHYLSSYILHLLVLLLSILVVLGQ